MFFVVLFKLPNKTEDPRNINEKKKHLLNDYYNKEKDIKIKMVLNM